MIRIMRKLASTRLTLVGMALLGVGAALSYDNPVSTPVWVLVVPLVFLALNLLSAIVTNSRINRRGGLLVFHVGLLSIIILAAIGRLTHMDAHLEIVQGGGFAKEDLIDVHSGPWHTGALDKVMFIQGPYTVDYAPGITRGLTHSHVLVPDGHGDWEERVIGDDRPLVINGYRFYTTFNKGFSPMLTWIPTRGRPVSGTVNMPSYPMFEFKQSNSWTPPGGKEIRFWLQLQTGMDDKAHWTLDASQARGTLVINSDNRRIELQPGESAVLDGGVLRYDRLASWMGYKLFYDPTLHWLFISAILAILGMAAHFWRKFSSLPLTAKESARAGWIAGDSRQTTPVNNDVQVSLAANKGQSHATVMLEKPDV
jgi:cytochrome c biogenesis protein ResB